MIFISWEETILYCNTSHRTNDKVSFGDTQGLVSHIFCFLGHFPEVKQHLKTKWSYYDIKQGTSKDSQEMRLKEVYFDVENSKSMHRSFMIYIFVTLFKILQIYKFFLIPQYKYIL